jgi:hypothetical protein
MSRAVCVVPTVTEMTMNSTVSALGTVWWTQGETKPTKRLSNQKKFFLLKIETCFVLAQCKPFQ